MAISGVDVAEGFLLGLLLAGYICQFPTLGPVLSHASEEAVHSVVWVLVNQTLNRVHSVQLWVKLKRDVCENNAAKVHGKFELLAVNLDFVGIFIQQESALI